MPTIYMFSYLILTMTRWEKYYMHVCCVNEDSKALWAVMECAWGSSFIRWSSESLTRVLPDRKACASELLLYTINGTNKYSIPMDSFSFVWRYQLLLFHHGCSSHLLSHDHQYRAGAKSSLWMTSLKALGSQWNHLSHVPWGRWFSHLSTLGQADVSRNYTSLKHSLADSVWKTSGLVFLLAEDFNFQTETFYRHFLLCTFSEWVRNWH